jgi:hypothetical protein
MKQPLKVISALNLVIFMIISIAIIILFPIQVNAEDRGWEHIPTTHDDNENYYYDPKSLTDVSDSIVRLWGRIAQEENDHFTIQMEIDCSKNAFRMKESFDNKSGKTSHVKSAGLFTWLPIEPGSIAKPFYEIACNKMVQLQPSGEGNIFIYSYDGTIEFVGDPVYPVYISIIETLERKPFEKIVKTVVLNDGDQFSIEAQLKPGMYQIVSSLDPKKDTCFSDSKYWCAFGPFIRIEEDGQSTTQYKELVHLLKMTLLYPKNKSTINENQPTLKWETVAGAAYYTVSWQCEKPLRFEPDIKVTESHYTFREDVYRGADYKWSVEAYNKNGDKIAYYSSFIFRTSE